MHDKEHLIGNADRRALILIAQIAVAQGSGSLGARIGEFRTQIDALQPSMTQEADAARAAEVAAQAHLDEADEALRRTLWDYPPKP